MELNGQGGLDARSHEWRYGENIPPTCWTAIVVNLSPVSAIPFNTFARDGGCFSLCSSMLKLLGLAGPAVHHMKASCCGLTPSLL